jgi:hypothetical protein
MLRKGFALLLAAMLAVVPIVEAVAQGAAAGGAGGGVPEGQMKTGAAENSKTNRDAANTDNNGNVMPKQPIAKSGSSSMDKK